MATVMGSLPVRPPIQPSMIAENAPASPPVRTISNEPGRNFGAPPSGTPPPLMPASAIDGSITIDHARIEATLDQ